MEKPKISVVMSVYNTRKEYLIESIESILNQSFDNFEFIIIDDASDSATKEILEYYTNDHRIKLITNSSNRGLTYNLNKGIAASKGEYIARMDSDDVCEFYRFEKQLRFLENHHEIAVLGTYYYILRDGKKKKHRCEAISPDNNNARWLFTNNGLMHASVMIRAELFERYQYDTYFKRTQDYDLWTRISKEYSITVLPEYLMSYRFSDDQISNKHSGEQKNFYNEIIARQLTDFYIDATEQQKSIHSNICQGIKNENVSDVYKWCHQIIDRNTQNNMYNQISIRYYALYYCLRNCVKSSMGVCDLLISIIIGFQWLFCSFGFYRNERKYKKRISENGF